MAEDVKWRWRHGQSEDVSGKYANPLRYTHSVLYNVTLNTITIYPLYKIPRIHHI